MLIHKYYFDATQPQSNASVVIIRPILLSRHLEISLENVHHMLAALDIYGEGMWRW